MSEIPDRVKETAKQEVEEIKKITQDGVRSGAYMYPIKVFRNLIP